MVDGRVPLTVGSGGSTTTLSLTARLKAKLHYAKLEAKRQEKRRGNSPLALQSNRT